MNRTATVALATLTLVLGLSGTPRAAWYSVYTNVNDGVTQIEDSAVATDPYDPFTYPDSSFGASAFSTTTVSLMQGTASASPKRVGVEVSGFWTFPWPRADSVPFASGLAEMTDTFTLTSVSHTQAQVIFSAGLSSVSGQWHETNGTLGYTFAAALGVPGSAGGSIYLQGDLTDGVASGDPINTVYSTAPLILPLNVPLGVSLYLVLGGGPSGAQSGSLLGNLGSSGYWGGMIVTDEFGEPIPGLGIESASGVNWLEAYSVPEPAAGGLVGGALGCILWRRRASA